MKNPNIYNAILLTVLCFLLYQIVDLKQEIRTIKDTQSQPPINIPNGFTLYGQSSSGTTNDGFWLFKDDHKILYLFRYNPNTNEITKIQRNIFDQ